MGLFLAAVYGGGLSQHGKAVTTPDLASGCSTTLGKGTLLDCIELPCSSGKLSLPVYLSYFKVNVNEEILALTITRAGARTQLYCGMAHILGEFLGIYTLPR